MMKFLPVALRSSILCILMATVLVGCGKKEAEPVEEVSASVSAVSEVEETEEATSEQTETEVTSEETEATSGEAETEASSEETEAVSAEPEETPAPTEEPVETETPEPTEERASSGLSLRIDETDVVVEWEDNEAVKALREAALAEPVEIDMHLYGGCEQVGSLGFDLPAEDEERTTDPGDIVLYQGNQLVVFYTSNTWMYTSLGRIVDKSDVELMLLLGGSDAHITITAE